MTNLDRIMQFPILDREAARTHLQYLDPDTEEFTFQTFTDVEERRKYFEMNPRTKRLFDPLARVFHGTLDQYWAPLADLSRQGAGVFVTVNRTTLQGRRNTENIVAVRVYVADCDEIDADTIKANLMALGLMPHLVIQTSEGKWRVYWLVDDAPLEGFKLTQNKLNLLMGSDKSVNDLPRVLRLAGFPHQKDLSKIRLVRILHTHDGPNYLNADFQRMLDSALAERRPKRNVAEAIMALDKPPPDFFEGYGEGRRNTECFRRADE
jgi:hypothetical protein